MDHPTRRNFLKDFGLGTASLSLAAGQAGASQMPGRPPSANFEAPSSHPSDIMAIAAHPGDGFFTMGAAVALQTHLGARGVFLSLSLGERGSAKIATAEYGALQREASERAAKLLGAQAAFLGYRDGEIPSSEEAKLAVCDLIREYKPATIVTHWRGSWHKDHQACYAIVNDAIFYAGLSTLARQHPAHSARTLFFAENWEDVQGFAPDTYLDVSPVFARWSEACAAFPMWRGETGFRYNDYYESLAVSRGCLSGSKHAVALMSAPEQLTRHVQAL
jgi:LmbE family N-acetylglucosaminyl deacetylase